MKTHKTIKRAASYFLAAVLLVLTLTTSITAFAYDPIQLTVTNANGAAGTDVTVSLNITANSGLAAADFVLTYDSAKLTFKSAVAGSAAAGNMSVINGAIAPRVKDSFIAMAGITAGGSMMDVTFTINEGWTGSTPLTLTHKPLKDKDGNVLTSTIIDGSVTLAVQQYTVNFNSNGGTAVAQVTQAANTQVAQPATPSKAGYTFAGWFYETGLINAVIWPYTLSAMDVTFYAKWTANTYTINYGANGGTGTTVSSLHTYDISSNLTASGYSKTGNSFLGWSTDSGASSPSYIDGQSVLNLTAVPNDILTFYAVWALNQYSITFNSAGGSAVDTISQLYETPVTAPANPARTGYTFNGWIPAVPTTMPAYNTECVAQWVINQYTVNFLSDGGSPVGAITQNYNTAITAPANPTKAGYTFAGWLPAVPSVMPANNTICVAKWTLNQYTMTFNTDGGSAVSSITQDYNTAITVPSNPTKPGYTFAGWAPMLPPTMPAMDTTYTALWTINQYTITFDSAGGSAVSPITQDYNSAVTAPENPTRTGYTFNGWLPAVPSTMPAGNTECVAQWTPIADVSITFDATGGSGGWGPAQMQPGAVLTAPLVLREGFVFTGWYPAVPPTVPGENTTYTAQWTIAKPAVTVTKTQAGMVINIEGWASDNNYQIWGYQKIVTDDILSNLEAQSEQWILLQPYTPGSLGTPAAGGNIEFTVPAFVSPDANYTIAVRVTDENGNFVKEYRDSYTPENVSEVVITKVLVDGEYSTGSEVKEIKGGASVLLKVVANNVAGTGFTAAIEETGTLLTVSNYNEFVWDISALTAGIYTVELTAGNGATSDSQTIEFQLYSSTEGIDYGTITSMEVTATGNTININPAFTNGSFWYRIREAGKDPLYTSGLIATPGNIEYTVSKPGIYQVSGYVNRQFVTSIGNAYDDSYVRTIEIVRTDAVIIPDPDPDPVIINFDANGGTGGTAGLQIPGKPISVPAVSREGYVLDGWVPALPATVPAVATAYTAQWISINDLPAAVMITFNANGGTGSTAGNQIPGRPMSAPIVTREGYVLDGWAPALPTKVPASPTLYTAQWKLAPGPVDPPTTKVTLTANAGVTLENVQKGATVTFTASASIQKIGSTPVEYSFWRYDAKGWVLVKDWSSSNTLTWTPMRVGDYTIQVRAKGEDAGSYEAMKSVEVTVTDANDKTAAVSNITINEADLNSNAKPRAPIVVRASATSTISEDLLYKFYVNDAAMGTSTLQNYSINQQCIWIPRKAGTYTISVLVKNSASYGKFDAIESFEITVD